MRLLIFFCLTFLSLSVLSKELNLLCKSNLNPDNHFFIELDISKNYVNVIIPFVSEENDMEFLSHLKALGLDVNDFTKSELVNVTETLLEIKYNIHLEKILDKGLQLAFPETMLRESSGRARLSVSPRSSVPAPAPRFTFLLLCSAPVMAAAPPTCFFCASRW